MGSYLTKSAVAVPLQRKKNDQEWTIIECESQQEDVEHDFELEVTSTPLSVPVNVSEEIVVSMEVYVPRLLSDGKTLLQSALFYSLPKLYLKFTYKSNVYLSYHRDIGLINKACALIRFPYYKSRTDVEFIRKAKQLTLALLGEIWRAQNQTKEILELDKSAYIVEDRKELYYYFTKVREWWFRTRSSL